MKKRLMKSLKSQKKFPLMTLIPMIQKRPATTRKKKRPKKLKNKTLPKPAMTLKKLKLLLRQPMKQKQPKKLLATRMQMTNRKKRKHNLAS